MSIAEQRAIGLIPAWSLAFLHSKSKRKEKEKKRNINNDLAVLPSHDTDTIVLAFLYRRYIFWINFHSSLYFYNVLYR